MFERERIFNETRLLNDTQDDHTNAYKRNGHVKGLGFNEIEKRNA